MDQEQPSQSNNKKPCPPKTVAIEETTTRSLKTEWLDSKQAAEYLCISVPSLRNMSYTRQIPYSKLGNRNRYRLDDLRKLLEDNRQGDL